MIANPPDPHVLIVRKIGQKWDPIHTPDWEDWEIIHNEECPRENNPPFGLSYTCMVGYEAEHVEPRWSLHYSGTPVEEPGYYLITTWHETYHGFDYTEYDGGICLYDPKEDAT
jgi:hypothetical protein